MSHQLHVGRSSLEDALPLPLDPVDLPVAEGLEINSPEPDISNETAATAARMKDLAIGFNGRQYTYAGYRYDRLSDAINYAELLRSRTAVDLGATPR